VVAEVTGSRLNKCMVCSNGDGGEVGALWYHDAVGEREGWRSASGSEWGRDASRKGEHLELLLNLSITPASTKSLLRWWSIISLPETRTGVHERLDKFIGDLHCSYAYMLTRLLLIGRHLEDGLSLVDLLSRHWKTTDRSICQVSTGVQRFPRLISRQVNR
jgi:hypothetical protein